MNSQSRLEISEKVFNLTKYISKKNYGETLTFQELNNFIHEDLSDEYGKNKFKRIMRKVKEALYKEGYVLRSVNNVGYYILKPNQIAGYTYRTFIRKPLNSLYKAQIILDYTKKDGLNTKQKERHNRTVKLNESLIYANTQILEDNEYKNLFD